MRFFFLKNTSFTAAWPSARRAPLSETSLWWINPQRGQSLIEILIATGVVALVMTAVAAGLALSVNNSSQARYRALAASEAQEGLELFRRERNRLGWESFYEVLDTQFGIEAVADICLGPDIPTTTQEFLLLTTGECETGYAQAGNTFIRQAEVELIDADTVSITVTVEWDQTDTRQRIVAMTQELRNLD